MQIPTGEVPPAAVAYVIIRRRCEVHGSTDLFDGKFKHGSINGGENCEESRSENILEHKSTASPMKWTFRSYYLSFKGLRRGQSAADTV